MYLSVGRFFVNSGLNGIRSGFGQGILEGESICSRGFYDEVYVWIYRVEVLLKFVVLIFPGGTVDIINIPEPPHLINVGDVGMAKSSQCSK